MRVYIVVTESGTIYSVRKSKTDAEAEKVRLQTLYENAIVKVFDVQ